MMVHSFVPHQHHHVRENSEVASENSNHGHDHDHENYHHNSENTDDSESTDQEKSESPFSHLLSPVEVSIYIGSQNYVSVEKSCASDNFSLITFFDFSSKVGYPIEKHSLIYFRRVCLDPPQGACGLRAPPIC